MQAVFDNGGANHGNVPGGLVPVEFSTPAQLFPRHGGKTRHKISKGVFL